MLPFAKTPAVCERDTDARNLAVLRKIVLTLFQQDAFLSIKVFVAVVCSPTENPLTVKNSSASD